MVKVRLDAIRRAWSRSEGESVLLGVQPTVGSDPTDPALLQTVTALVTAANQDAKARWSEVDRGHGDEPVATAVGPVVYLTAYDKKAMEAWVGHLAQGLEDGAYACTLGVARTEHPPIKLAQIATKSPPTRCFAAVLSLRGWTLRPDRDRPQTRGAWATDPALAAELADWAVSWTNLSGGDCYVGALRFSMRAEPTSAAGLLRPALCSTPAIAEVSSYVGADEARRVRFESAGRLILEIMSTSRPWQDIVSELTELLRLRADTVDYAFIRQAWLFAGAIDGVTNRMPPRQPHRLNQTAPTSQFRERQHLDDTFVPDAQPIQILSDIHLSRAHDLSRWTTVEVAPGRHLVSASELEPWFAHPDIESTAVERARADFGNLILLDQLL